MSRLMCLIVFGMAASAACADEKPKPNTLTQKEIEEGWILLFDGETTFGWKVEGEVKVEDGLLVLGGNNKSSIETNAAFGLCTVRMEYDRIGHINSSIASRDTSFCVHKSPFWWGQLRIDVSPNGGLEADFNSPLIGVRMASGRAMAPGDPPPDKPLGPIRFEVPAGSKLWIKSIKLKPNGTQLLLNGKDLAGWKVFDDAKRNKSQWTVTKEGRLNVKLKYSRNSPV